jgi:hypothetical protein
VPRGRCAPRWVGGAPYSGERGHFNLPRTSATIIGKYLGGEILPPTDRFDVLVQMLGASSGEQGMLATVRDRVEERRRAGAPDAGGRTVVPRALPAPAAHFTGRQGDRRCPRRE